MGSAARTGICMVLLGCGSAAPGSGGGSGGATSGGDAGGPAGNVANTGGVSAGGSTSTGQGAAGRGSVGGNAPANGGAAGLGGGTATAAAGNSGSGTSGGAGESGAGGKSGDGGVGGRGGSGGSGGKSGEGGAGSASHPGDAVEFQGHFYRFTKAAISGASAESICEGLGGYLACIETENENAFLLTLAGNARPWFGLNNLADQKVWVWINGSPTTYEHWQPGQPDNPANEHWGKLLETGLWDDGSIETSYLCEWDR